MEKRDGVLHAYTGWSLKIFPQNFTAFNVLKQLLNLGFKVTRAVGINVVIRLLLLMSCR
ncbi:MAG: hypothetical protein H0A75_06205 [Candidatus Methanofishera endochildressiae]|uniref:Uncharacterized protein n=1 Tax=Candidatus Methanofishera endochildressiae TaxID=2738884 RepID=A0A7Z0MPK2_9GAMM|nr:hypothetical protein [Candidatus Methanofishera endochildressiae]